MFDIGFFELVLIGVVGLLVLGPERLPHAVRMGSAYLGKIRRAVSSVREEFEREVNVQEMQQRIKQQMEDSGLDEARQSLQDLKKQVESPTVSTASKSAPGDNSIGGSLPQQASSEGDEDPDTRHNPTEPENEAEPMPEPAPEAATDPAPEKDTPKA